MGIAFKLDEFHRNVTSESLLEDLLSVARQIGKPTVSKREYAAFGRFSYETILRRFGSWAAAGLTISAKYKPKATDDELFANLAEVWRALGRQPRIEDMSPRISKYCGATYKKRFSGWRKALEAFIGYVEREGSLAASLNPALASPNSRPACRRREPNWRERYLVLRRDHFTCTSCGRSPAKDPSVNLHIDHVEAWSRGGPTIVDNFQTLCDQCNIGKGNL